MTLDRRDFLRLSAAVAVTAASATPVPGGVGVADAHVLPSAAMAPPILLEALGEDAVRAIGARYRDAVPTESDTVTLRALLVDADERHSPVDSDAASALAARIARDFAEGRTVLVDGWELALTEARQCALFSLVDA